MRENEKAMADATQQTKDAVKEVKLPAHAAVASGMTVRQAIASKADFNTPTRVRVLPPPSTCQRQSRSARGEAIERKEGS